MTVHFEFTSAFQEDFGIKCHFLFDEFKMFEYINFLHALQSSWKFNFYSFLSLMLIV